MRSQLDEEAFLLKHFTERPPQHKVFLDIGASDGLKNSNTRGLFEAGWKGVLVEPEPRSFERLAKHYSGAGCVLVNAAVGDRHSRGPSVELSFPKTDDWDWRAQLSTCIGGSQQKKWEERGDVRNGWKVVMVPLVTLSAVMALCEKPPEFLSIDCEGMDYEILESGIAALRANPPAVIMAECGLSSSLEKPFTDLLGKIGYTKIYANPVNVGYAMNVAAAP